MIQAIYGVLAILLVALLSLTMNGVMMHSQHKMVLNEVSTQVTGIGTHVLEHLASLPFDENTDESDEGTTYPVIRWASELTAESEFGGCTEFNYEPEVCEYLDDYDDLTFEHEVGGISYTVSIAVQYVDPETHEPSGGTRTFAKEVAVTITSPHLQMGRQPLTVTMARVFTYNRHTNS